MDNKYDTLKNIKLNEFGLLKCSIIDPVYKFCLLNDIDNLGDFIKIYQEKKQEMDSRHNFDYFDGIVDLINLKYFDENLCVGKNLLKEIEIKRSKVSYENYVRVKDDYYNKSLRRLGLTQNETKILLWYVFNCNEEMKVIVAIKSYIDSVKPRTLNVERKMLLKKLELLSNYYDKHKEELDLLNSVIFYKAENLLKEYKSLYKNLLNVKKNLIEVSNDFKNAIAALPKEHENVKQLIKSYEEIDCNEE